MASDRDKPRTCSQCEHYKMQLQRHPKRRSTFASRCTLLNMHVTPLRTACTMANKRELLRPARTHDHATLP